MAAQLSRIVRSLSFATRQSTAFVLTGNQAAAVAALSTLFVLHCCVPLRPSGIFRDLIDAEAIVAAGKLPAADPLLPYADHARFAILNAGGALIERTAWNLGGASGLLILSAALATAATGLWCGWAVRRSGSFSVAAPIWLWTLTVGWGSYDAAGTFRFGLVLLPLSFLVMDAADLWSRGEASLRDGRSARTRQIAFASMPVLFALWANLDASWILGLAALWLVAIGRTIEILQDRRARRASGAASVSALLSTALAATLATLANPYGWKLWGLLTLPPANSPFVATLGPFVPVAAWSLTGILSAVALAAAGIGLANRGFRCRWVETLLIAFGLACAFAFVEGRLWTLPLLGALALPPVWRTAMDWLDLYRVRQPAWRDDSRARSIESNDPRPSSSRWAPTGFASVSLASAFLLTPLSDPLLGREPETLEAVVVDAPLADVPDGAFDAGVAFVPPWWSDACAFQRMTNGAAAEHSAPRLLADSRQATLPPSTREDVARILAGDNGWAAILDRYETKTLLLDGRRQAELVDLVRSEPRWREVASTESLVVFRREDRRR